MMKNDFEIRGDITAIFLRRKDGTLIETIIDTSDLNNVQSFDGRWFAQWSPSGGSFYPVSHVWSNGKKTATSLYRWILKTKPGRLLDHINHDTLDNRRANLREVTHAENMQNRKGAHRNNNTSGIRGVDWSKSKGKWRARIVLNSKKKHVGYFDDLREAEKAVIEARAKFMPYSLEALAASV